MIKIIMATLFAGILGSCSGSSSTPSIQPQFLSGTPLQVADMVIQSINQLQNGSGGLTPFVNMFDSGGVRFSADYYIEITDRVLTASEFKSEFSLKNPPTYMWGIQDGSGDLINKNIHDYFSHYVWDFPYNDNATITLIKNSNDFNSQGNLINNMLSFYSSAQYKIVEYYQSGTDPNANGMDWSSLMIVLESQGTHQWSLVGLVHGAWTI